METSARTKFIAAILFGSSLLLAPLDRALADQAAADSLDTPVSSSQSSSGNTYNNVHHFGLGLAWAPMDMVQATEGPNGNTNVSDVFTNVGFVDARYWFNDRFGLDGGIGFGLPQVSPRSSFLATLNVEPMLALITRPHSLFYANLDLIPALNTGAGLPSAVTLSAGVGIETEIADISRLAWFAQWNPLSLNWNLPNDGPTETGFTFLGSLMNVMVGFHYYF